MTDTNELNHEIYCGRHPFRRISWTAIFVGALTAIGLGFLLNLFGFAIGLSAIKLASDGSISLAVGGLLGIIVGVIASMLVSGYAAGYLGRLYCPLRNLGIVYGFTTWVVALLLSAAIIGSLSRYAEYYTNTIYQSAAAVTHNQIKTGSSTEITASSTKNPQLPIVKVNVSTTTLTSGAFIIFGLFFIGALFSCIGACWGMSCKRDD